MSQVPWTSMRSIYVTDGHALFTFLSVFLFVFSLGFGISFIVLTLYISTVDNFLLGCFCVICEAQFFVMFSLTFVVSVCVSSSFAPSSHVGFLFKPPSIFPCPPHSHRSCIWIHDPTFGHCWEWELLSQAGGQRLGIPLSAFAGGYMDKKYMWLTVTAIPPWRLQSASENYSMGGGRGEVDDDSMFDGVTWSRIT
jgi:hypothetical protein